MENGGPVAPEFVAMVDKVFYCKNLINNSRLGLVRFSIVKFRKAITYHGFLIQATLGKLLVCQ
jgi:hypothetical protein